MKAETFMEIFKATLPHREQERFMDMLMVAVNEQNVPRPEMTRMELIRQRALARPKRKIPMPKEYDQRK